MWFDRVVKIRHPWSVWSTFCQSDTLEPRKVKGTSTNRFLAIGGLHRLLDSAPDQVASNLYRYYHGVGTFNNEAALRERLVQKLFNVTGPATAGIFRSVKSSDKRLESWLTEVPSRLAVLMRDMQHVLGELGHMPEVISSRDDETRLAIVDRRDTEAYNRWRERHGDVPAPSNKTHRDWSIHDDPVR